MSGIVLIPFYKHLTENSLNKNCFSEKEVNERTAELYTNQGHTDINELVVIDKRRNARRTKDTMQKESPSAFEEPFCQNYQQKTNNC